MSVGRFILNRERVHCHLQVQNYLHSVTRCCNTFSFIVESHTQVRERPGGGGGAAAADVGLTIARNR